MSLVVQVIYSNVSFFYGSEKDIRSRLLAVLAHARLIAVICDVVF